MIKVPGYGAARPRIMIVGEAPGKTEVQEGRPFVGASGIEMTKMLHEAGIARADCYLTNVCKYQPPGNKIEAWFYNKTDAGIRQITAVNGRYPNEKIFEGLQELYDEIDRIKPNVIIAFGATPLWAICGHEGITKWRGSAIPSLSIRGNTFKVVPTYHPAAVLRMWAWRYLAVHDLRRARRESLYAHIKYPNYSFVLRPTFSAAMGTLSQLLTLAEEAERDGDTIRLGVDIETRRRHIACIGVAWSNLEAICIPLMCLERDEGYWSLEEEAQLILRIRELFLHPAVELAGQNWHYDAQYIGKHWGFIPFPEYDTMIQQHVCWAGMKKGLDFISSLYLRNHIYWKDEGKEWDPRIHSEEDLWAYNCKDCCVTLECSYELEDLIEQLNLTEQIDFQMELWRPTLHMMLRGIARDPKVRIDLTLSLMDDIAERENYLARILGHPINPRSPKQLTQLFYTDFQHRRIYNYKTKKTTLDEDALMQIAKENVILTAVCFPIIEVRKLGQALGFVNTKIDADNRIHSSMKQTGTETYRYASSKDAFGFGTNLQNITVGDKGEDVQLTLPNLRKMFIPDPGCVMFDVDLPQADAQVVAWEAGDEDLKAIFRDPSLDLHDENCKLLFPGPVTKHNRDKVKVGVHAINYCVTAFMLAKTLRITRHEADAFIKRWFDAHPKILDWHEEIQNQLMTRRYVENKYGFRRFYFDRIENLLKEAVAWIPQSTTAIATNKIIVNIWNDKELPAEVLLQVHDSVLGQYPEGRPQTLKELKRCCRVVVPYEDPLVFQAGLSLSSKSWGDVEKLAWPD